jgi:hypothetical protein
LLVYLPLCLQVNGWKPYILKVPSPVAEECGYPKIIVIFRWAVPAGTVRGDGAQLAQRGIVAVRGTLADKYGTKIVTLKKSRSTWQIKIYRGHLTIVRLISIDTPLNVFLSWKFLKWSSSMSCGILWLRQKCRLLHFGRLFSVKICFCFRLLQLTMSWRIGEAGKNVPLSCNSANVLANLTDFLNNWRHVNPPKYPQNLNIHPTNWSSFLFKK